MSLPNPGPPPVLLYATDASGNFPAQITGREVDTDGNPTTDEGMLNLSYLYGFNGASWDRVRLADVFKTVVATAAGNTAVWTPGAGNYFRLMGFSITVAGTIAAAGVQTIQLLDGATAIKNFVTPLGTTATAVSSAHFGEDMGQGYRSSALANVLEINLADAMLTGGVAINVWGTQGPTA